MTRYRLHGTVDEAHLSRVIAAFSEAGVRSDYDPEIGVNLLTKFNELASAPKYAPGTPDGPGVALTPIPHPKPEKKRTVRRTHQGNGGEWPAKDSIYDVVLQALQNGIRVMPADLREVLKSRGFSAGSLNSALGRLEKANKVRHSEDGGWIAA